MITTITGGKAAVVGLVLLTSMVATVKAVQAHLAPDYQAVVEGAGPIVPGTFKVVAQSDTVDGHLVVYTVQRPGHPGTGLGAILTHQVSILARVAVDAGESDRVDRGPIRYGTLDTGTRRLVYGVITTPGVATIEATTADGGSQTVQVQPGGGFAFYVPSDDAGAIIKPAGGG